MLNGHAYSRAVRAHILTNLILAGIILDEIDLTGKERAETENKLRDSERSLILFVKENRTYQSLHCIIWKVIKAVGPIFSHVYSRKTVHPGRASG
jgi:hypothetical protein